MQATSVNQQVSASPCKTMSPSKRNTVLSSSARPQKDCDLGSQISEGRSQPKRNSQPLSILAMVVIASSMASYFAGRAARMYAIPSQPKVSLNGMANGSSQSKPSPKIQTRDSTDTCASVSSASWISLNEDIITNEAAKRSANDVDVDDDDDELLPFGSHLLLDFQGVDGDFIQSIDHMTQALLDLVEQQSSFEVQYTYSKTTSRGNVIVGGVSYDRHHIWMYGWPRQGTILLDMFAGDESQDLVSLIPKVENYFADKGPCDSNEPSTSSRWVHKSRGFHDMLGEADTHAQVDLQWFPIGTMIDYKKEVATIRSPFQRISVWDVAKSKDDSEQVDRIVFLDGLLQSRRTGDAAYHEALVHTAMFTHPNPKRVAIIGGGEGATLREVLKHNTVQEVVMIEIDEIMVNASRTFLPEWSDCSNLEGNTGNCFDNPRTSLYFEDAFQWFKSRYADNTTSTVDWELFDVIIMDALDPQGAQEIVEALYTDDAFYQSLYNGLSPNGILLAQVGESPYLDDAYYSFTDRNFLSFINGLKRLGFGKITEYEEGDCGFFAPWSFVMASKQSEPLNENLLMNEALVNLKIRQRIIPTVDGVSSLLYFDGATMNKYKYPSKPMEEMYCLNPDMPQSCKGGQGLVPKSFNTLENSTILYSEAEPQSSFSVETMRMDLATQNVIGRVERECGSGICRNSALRSLVDAYGWKGVAGTFIPVNPAHAFENWVGPSAPRTDVDDVVLHRHATSVSSMVYATP